MSAMAEVPTAPKTLAKDGGRIVIVGAGHAGTNAAKELRLRGFSGEVVLVSEETHLPYERPPLSKDALLHPEQARLHLHPREYYDESGITLLLGVRAERIDAALHRLHLSDGTHLAYDKLLLATGSQARRLPQLDLLGDSVHVLRTLQDAIALRAEIRTGMRAVLVGAGVIGLELASSLTELGVQVAVVEPAARPMLRNAPEAVGRFLQQVHESRGVVFHLGTTVRDARQVSDGSGRRIRLALDNGVELEADLLVYGVGAVVDGRLAETAGLRTEHGAVLVDENGRTAQADIYAAGDAAAQIAGRGPHRRMETWENAIVQSTRVVCDMLQREPPPADAPWFWTDQCGLNVQFAGDMAASHWLVRGTLGKPPFMLWGLDEQGAVTAAVTVNQGKDMRPARELIAHRVRISADILTDPTTNLRALAKASVRPPDAELAPAKEQYV